MVAKKNNPNNKHEVLPINRGKSIRPQPKGEGHYVGQVFADKLSNARTIARKMYGKDSNIGLELIRSDENGNKIYRVIIYK